MSNERHQEELAQQYSPLPPESVKRILARWREYKETIGLEGDLYLRMKREGINEEEIEVALQENRLARQSLIEDFRKSSAE